MRVLISSSRSALVLMCLLCPLHVETSFAAEILLANPGAVHSITLPHFEPDMPNAPGREEFIRACFTCHSPRYVTMQPPFPRHQWAETVAKMIKNYGAPADEEQARAIVDYLAATHGVAPMANLSASSDDDEESGSVTSGSAPQSVETFPLLEVAVGTGEFANEVSRGAAVFAQDCRGCHGVAGRGDGMVSQALLPRPVDLTAAQFDVRFLSQTLWNGVRGTSMPSWRILPREDLIGLVAYVRTLHPVANPDHAPVEVLTQGRVLFQKNCAVCHGELGDGKSVVAPSLSPPPANLKWIQPDFDHILTVLRDGIPGTAMPSWKDQISESDRKALAAFVRSLYEASQHRKDD